MDDETGPSAADRGLDKDATKISGLERTDQPVEQTHEERQQARELKAKFDRFEDQKTRIGKSAELNRRLTQASDQQELRRLQRLEIPKFDREEIYDISEHQPISLTHSYSSPDGQETVREARIAFLKTGTQDEYVTDENGVMLTVNTDLFNARFPINTELSRSGKKSQTQMARIGRGGIMKSSFSFVEASRS